MRRLESERDSPTDAASLQGTGEALRAPPKLHDQHAVVEEEQEEKRRRPLVNPSLQSPASAAAAAVAIATQAEQEQCVLAQRHHAVQREVCERLCESSQRRCA